MYEAEREDGEEFNAFAERVGTIRFEDEVRDLALPVEFSLETMNTFIDWDRERARSRSSAARASARSERRMQADARARWSPRQATPRRSPRAAVLLPEGGVGARRRAARRSRPTRASSRSTPACCSPRRSQTWKAFEDRFGVDSRGRATRRGRRAVDRARALLLDRARSPRSSSALERRRRLDHRPAPRAGADARRHASTSSCDDKRGIWKYNPLADWTEKDLWRDIHEHDLPYHPLHDQGYASIGCAPLHPARRRPRGPLGGHRQDRVRAARRAAGDDRTGADWTRSIIVFGLGVGILSALTGIGGGSLMTPLLLILSSAPTRRRRSAPTSPTARSPRRVGGWRHLRNGTVDLGVVASGSRSAACPARSAASCVLDRLQRRSASGFDDALLWRVAGALLLVVASRSLARALFMPQARRARARQRRRSTTRAQGRRRRASALVLGFILGLTSVGSGALIGLALILVFRLTPHRVVGTDVFHAAILLWVAGLAAARRRQRRLRADGQRS